MNKKLKILNEKKADLQKEMSTLLDTVKTEERAFTEEENTRFTELEKNIALILDTVKAIESERELTDDEKDGEDSKKDGEGVAEQRALNEEKLFERFIRNKLEERDTSSMTFGDNGAVVPTTIASKIIAMVYDISPVLARSTKYNVKGKLEVPYYAEEGTAKITMAYQAEFTALQSKIGKFASIELTGYLAGALTKISNSLINNSNFDVVNEVIKLMAIAISVWVEGELINGTDTKIDGLSKGVTKEVKTTSATVIVADEVIKLKRKIKSAFQKDACFIMSNDTLTALQLLKDNNGRYLLNDDLTGDYDGILLGKPVFVSDNMKEIGSGNTVIYYGDLSGLATKFTEEVSIQILREKYADEHATGVIAWTELDAKVEDAQKIAKLTMATA